MLSKLLTISPVTAYQIIVVSHCLIHYLKVEDSLKNKHNKKLLALNPVEILDIVKKSSLLV